MASNSPSYITRNRFGIFIFQWRVPQALRRRQPHLPQLIRRSLRTRDRRVALREARRLIVAMEDSPSLSEPGFEPEARAEDQLFHEGLPLWRDLLDLESEGDYAQREAYLSHLTGTQQRAIEYMARRNDSLVEQANTALQSGDGNQCARVLDRFASIDYRALPGLADRLNRAKASNEPTPPVPHAESHPPSAENPSLAKLFDRWKDAQSGMAVPSYSEYTRMIAFFIRIVQELNNDTCPTAAGLTRELIRGYKKIQAELPKNTKTLDRPISELRDLKGSPRSQTTIAGIFTNVGHFLQWIEGEGYPIDPQIRKVLIYTSKGSTRSKKNRKPFDSHDLKALFESKQYTDGLWRRSSEYWAPLIALFTGATMSEILQLHVTDIRQEQNIWLFDFNENADDKRLKTAGTNEDVGRPRLVPVHRTLHSLEFLSFVKWRSASGDKLLFPEEKRNDARQQFRAYSGRFGRFRDKVDAGPRDDRELRDFHSFRHLFKTKLSNLTPGDNVIDDLLGHTSPGRSAIGQKYNHAQRLDLKNQLLNKLEYSEIEFDRIRHWKRHLFAQNAIKTKRGK